MTHQVRAYSYVNKNGKTVHVRAHMAREPQRGLFPRKSRARPIMDLRPPKGAYRAATSAQRAEYRGFVNALRGTGRYAAKPRKRSSRGIMDLRPPKGAYRAATSAQRAEYRAFVNALRGTGRYASKPRK